MSKNDEKQLDALGLSMPEQPLWKRLLKYVIWLLVIAALISAVYYFMQDEDNTLYKTDPASRQDLAVTVSATGSIEPKDQVEVSSELSGIVSEVTVDYNDHVKKGDVLARLDATTQKAAVLVDKANLRSAEASVLQAEAELEEAQQDYSHYQKVWQLSNGKVPSKQELDSYRIAVKVAQANLSSARASVEVAEADLESSQSDLKKTAIISPIDGVVLSKDIEVGKTVASSLEAPTLFLLARDLTQMELHVDIDEADIGLIHTGQDATFTVDAYGEREFSGKIIQIRLADTDDDDSDDSDSSVVSYETVLSVENADLKLLPSMTAITDVKVEEEENVLTVANAALRFHPDADTSEDSDSSDGGILSSIMPGPPGRKGKKGPSGGPGSPMPDDRDDAPKTTVNGSVERDHGVIWVLRQGRAVAVDVETGISDSFRTQILSGDLQEGDEVITDAVTVDR